LCGDRRALVQAQADVRHGSMFEMGQRLDQFERILDNLESLAN
jgi:hypothetical protein